MTQTEKAMKWLKDHYGITSEAELDQALARTKLDIGIFVSPLPGIAQLQRGDHLATQVKKRHFEKKNDNGQKH